MIKIGLTGSIGMGKSATAEMFRNENIPVYDADAAVHSIYEPGGSAVAPIGDRFPGTVVGGRVDRSKLREAVLNNQDALKDLEAIVHPLVGQTQKDFLEEAAAKGADMVVLDIPLLFETGGNNRVELVVVVTAPAEVQRQRVLERGTMSEADFEAVLNKQTPDAEKRARADFIIMTGYGFEYAKDQVKALIKAVRAHVD